MRVLYLFPRAPLPANNGETIRNVALLRATRDVADVLDVLTLPQPDGPAAREGLDELRAICDGLSVVGAPVGDYLGAPRRRVATVLGRPYHLSVAGDRLVRSAIVAAVGRRPYDVIVASQLTTAPAVPASAHRRLVFDTHNVESLRMADLLRTSAMGRPVMARVLRGVQRLESGIAGSAARTLVCSDEDRLQLQALAPSGDYVVIPNGSDASPRSVTPTRGDRPLLFLASLDYSANIDSLDFLVHDILPRITGRPRLLVAGSNADRRAARVLRSAPGNVEFVGRVEDPQQVMAESQALLVPLRAGGGTRLKILEAFGVGLPVVTTSKGAEGLPVVGGRHAMVEDTAAGFAKAVESVLSDSATCARLASAAAELVNAGFRWPAIAARFQRVLGEVAAEGRVIAGGIDDGPSESSRRAG